MTRKNVSFEVFTKKGQSLEEREGVLETQSKDAELQNTSVPWLTECYGPLWAKMEARAPPKKTKSEDGAI